MNVKTFNRYEFNLRGRTTGQFKTECVFCQNERTKNKADKPASVNLNTGVFKCHHCGRAGMLHEYTSEKAYELPKWNNKTKLSDKVVQFFEGRKISQEVITRMQVAEGTEWMGGQERNTIQFPYFLDGKVVNVKYRTGDKKFKLHKNARLIPYNIDSVKEADTCTIVEGELDCLSFLESGVSTVISVPNGASSTDWLDDVLNYFDDKRKIILATDNDTKGIELMDNLIRRLGSHRCHKVDFNDCKDANEFLIKYGSTRLRAVHGEAKLVPMDGVILVKDIEDRIYDLHKNGLQPGMKIGLRGFDDICSFDTGRLCLVTGIPSHGKSEFVDQMMIGLSLNYGIRWGVFSPENHPLEYHFSKLAEKLTGMNFNKDMQGSDIDSAITWLNDKFYFIDPDEENYTLDYVLNKAKELVMRFGISGLVLDPWNKFRYEPRQGESETKYVERRLDDIIILSKKQMLFTVLVAHPTKMKKDGDKYEVPTMYDISGSAHFYNKADFGVSVYRNFKINDEDEESIDIHVQKVKYKHWGAIGKENVKYNENNGRFTPIVSGDPDWDDRNWITDEPKRYEPDDDIPF